MRLGWDAIRSRDVIKLSCKTTISPRPLSGFSGKKGLCHIVAFSPALLLSSLSTVDAEEANENVRRDRIIHCPTKTGGASRLFGERIHLVRATAILDGEREREREILVILEILPPDSFYVQIHSWKRLLPYRRVASSQYRHTFILLYTYVSYSFKKKKLSEYTVSEFGRRLEAK